MPGQVIVNGQGRFKKYTAVVDDWHEAFLYLLNWCVANHTNIVTTVVVSPGVLGCPEGGTYDISIVFTGPGDDDVDVSYAYSSVWLG